jgi:hypothetical protein
MLVSFLRGADVESANVWLERLQKRYYFTLISDGACVGHYILHLASESHCVEPKEAEPARLLGMNIRGGRQSWTLLIRQS